MEGHQFVRASSNCLRCRPLTEGPFQVLNREALQDPFFDLILAEDSLVFPKAKAPKPNHDVHDGAQTQGCRTSSCRPRSVSRTCRYVRSIG